MRITHRLLVSVVLLPLVILTIVGAVMLWPEHGKHRSTANLGANTTLVNATATKVTSAPCVGDPSSNVCQTLEFRVTSGPDAGQTVTLTMQSGPGQPVIEFKDKVVLGRSADAPDAPATYYFSDFQRKPALFWIGLAFAVLVLVIARWRGLGALVGLVFTFFTITTFILPAILEGTSPMLVALTGSAAIVIVVLYVAHGFKASTTIALIGTLLSLGLTCLLAVFAVKLAHLTGLSSEEATYVQNYAGQVNLQGLLLAGVIIGSLGVLNDTTVTQSSSVWEIHQAQPTRSRRSLYTSAMSVGRDHIASSVYTLVLAYVGAALPLLILFSIADRQISDIVGSDVVAEEIVRTLVGSIGLMLSVPLTTGLAVLVMNNRTEPTAELAVDLDPRTMDPDGSADEDAVVSSDIEMAMAGGPSISSDASDEDKPITFEPVVSPTRRRGAFRRRPVAFDRKMSRRERKFWESD